jgi:TPR repeat protein
MTSSFQPDALELVRALVRDKTRFAPGDLQPAGGADGVQPLLLSARYSLAAQRDSCAIDGASFTPAADDVRSLSLATVESDADWEDHGRLAQSQDLLARQLEANGSAWNIIGDGVYLGHHRRHWHLASCRACSGAGRVVCAACAGRREVPCDSCAGGGQVPCPDCAAGKASCPTCHGSKRVACGRCGGDGAVLCGACDGAGAVQCAPCAGSGQHGLAAWVDIHVSVQYVLALPDTADADVRAIAAAGPHAIAPLASTLALRHVEAGAGGQLRADYALQLRVVRQDVACNGQVYQLLAYGNPLQWHTLGGIVEDLLRHDLQALVHALGAADRQGWLATDTGALLPPLHAVTASELNFELIESLLDESLLDGAPVHGAAVSNDYAEQVRTAVLSALRHLHTRVARRTWWHGALAAALATVAAWAWSQLPWGSLAGAAVTAGAWLLFRRRVRVLLTRALGGRHQADRAIALARRSQRERVANTLIVAPALLALAGLGAVLPWQGPLAPHHAGAGSSRAGSPGGARQAAIATSAQRAEVAPALARYAAGDLAAARRTLATLAQRGNAAVWGPYGWMVLQGEGLNAQQLAAVDSASAARRQQARPWIAKGLDVGDLWAQAAQGVLQLDQHGGDREQAIFLLTMAAQRHHAPAMQALGTAYREGRHVARDDTAARKWLTEAADLGRPSAQYQLGVLDWYGLGGARADKTRAMALWRQAAAAGDPAAVRAVRAGRPD